MIHGENINDLDDFKQVIAGLPDDRNVPMRIIRRGAALFIPLHVPK